MTVHGRLFIARHGETVFNAARLIQGGAPHTPLTRAGFLQAEKMGSKLRRLLGPAPPLTLWSSTAGRALQTLAIIAEHLELDWHGAKVDDRLREIDMGGWSGRSYADLVAEGGPVLDRETGLFIRRCADGEWYDQISTRLAGWLADIADDPGDKLVVMHGVSSRVLRAMLTGVAPHPRFNAPVLPGLPQGSVVVIEQGVETVALTGDGHAPA